MTPRLEIAAKKEDAGPSVSERAIRAQNEIAGLLHLMVDLDRGLGEVRATLYANFKDGNKWGVKLPTGDCTEAMSIISVLRQLTDRLSAASEGETKRVHPYPTKCIECGKVGCFPVRREIKNPTTNEVLTVWKCEHCGEETFGSPSDLRDAPTEPPKFEPKPSTPVDLEEVAKRLLELADHLDNGDMGGSANECRELAEIIKK